MRLKYTRRQNAETQQYLIVVLSSVKTNDLRELRHIYYVCKQLLLFQVHETPTLI